MNLDTAIKNVLETLKKRPEKNILNIWTDLEKGQRPEYCPLIITRQVDSSAETTEIPGVELSEDTFANQVANILKPLLLENPIYPVLTLEGGESTGFLPAGLSATISTSPTYRGGIAKHLSLEEIEKIKEPPIPQNEPRFHRLKEKIDFYLKSTPPDFKIGLPDMQGLFNIAYALLGSEIFLLMTDNPEIVHRTMKLVTEYYVRCYRWFMDNIPEDRWISYVGKAKMICECEVNLISRAFYKEFVAPYDRKIVDFWKGEVAIHPCSGPHVFEVTLEIFAKEIRYTECGIIPCACAGYLTMEQALEKIKGKPIILSVGEELVEGKEEKTIQHHLDCIKVHPLMLFTYTGMYWKKQDDEFIKNLHRKLDEYYYQI